MNNMLKVVAVQQLRGLILQVCNATTPNGASLQLIAAALKREGYGVSFDDTQSAVEYLAGKGLVAVELIQSAVLNIERHVVKITPAGVDTLEGTTAVDGVLLDG